MQIYVYLWGPFSFFLCLLFFAAQANFVYLCEVVVAISLGVGGSVNNGEGDVIIS